MPLNTVTTPTPGINYCFLLKCLGSIALCGFIIAMLMKPSYIVVAAATALAPALASVVFFPLVALLALTLMVGLAASISSTPYIPGPRPQVTVAYPWYTPGYWFGPTYARYGWADYMFPQRPGIYHTRNPGLYHYRSSTSAPYHGGNQHGHPSTGGVMNNHSMFRPVNLGGYQSRQHTSGASMNTSQHHGPSMGSGGRYHGR